MLILFGKLSLYRLAPVMAMGQRKPHAPPPPPPPTTTTTTTTTAKSNKNNMVFAQTLLYFSRHYPAPRSTAQGSAR